ncbi:MAG: enoyl-CoA hydratase/isomerase family protein [Candidatus Aenigmatarchaeota archaeon]
MERDYSKYFRGKPAESFNFKDIIYQKKDGVATIIINRPEVYNAYSTVALEEMIVAFKDASWDDGIHAVVLTGAGHIAFCTGGDVKEYQENYTKRPRDFWKWMGLFNMAHELFRNIGKPTIARLNGMTVGGGNEWNIEADIAIAASHVRIRQVGTNVGSVAAGGSTQILPIMVGDRRAREILLTNDWIDARTALQWGLVNRVVPSVKKDGRFLEDHTWSEAEKAIKGVDGYSIDLSLLDEEVMKWCEKFREKFPECTRYTRQQLNFWKDLVWHLTIGHARDWLSVHFSSWEPWEGMTAFVEKRKADYEGMRRRASEGKSSEFKWGPPVKNCMKCGAKGIPEEFNYCGICGEKLQ